MSRACDRTIGPRTRSRWCDDESASCSASNHRAPPSASSACMLLSTTHQPSAASCLSLNAPDLPIRCGCAMAQRDRRRMKPSPLYPISAETAQLDNAVVLHHPHLRCVVAGGGLSADGTRWIAIKTGEFARAGTRRNDFINPGLLPCRDVYAAPGVDFLLQ